MMTRATIPTEDEIKALLVRHSIIVLLRSPFKGLSTRDWAEFLRDDIALEKTVIYETLKAWVEYEENDGATTGSLDREG